MVLTMPDAADCGKASKDCFWPAARDRRGSPKLSITGRSKPTSDCFRGVDRNGALGHELPLMKVRLCTERHAC